LDLDAQYSKSMESLQQLIKIRTENQKAAIPDDEDDIFGIFALYVYSACQLCSSWTATQRSSSGDGDVVDDNAT